MRFDVLVEIRLRPGIADPQGATVERALPALGFDGVSHVGVGKAIRFALDAPDEALARSRVEELCQRFLANPVIEDAEVTLSAGAMSAGAGPAGAMSAGAGRVGAGPAGEAR